MFFFSLVVTPLHIKDMRYLGDFNCTNSIIMIRTLLIRTYKYNSNRLVLLWCYNRCYKFCANILPSSSCPPLNFIHSPLLVSFFATFVYSSYTLQNYIFYFLVFVFRFDYILNVLVCYICMLYYFNFFIELVLLKYYIIRNLTLFLLTF